MTGQAAEKLTDLFQFNIPQRWSIAHLYQVILNKEAHIKDISHQTTLASCLPCQTVTVDASGVPTSLRCPFASSQVTGN